MKELPIGRQTFSKLIEQDLLYIDKTELIWKLINGGEYYFLSRPRRFGKSLLLSTLKAYFEGRKELFQNLYIDKKEKEWNKYPIIHIDYSRIEYRVDVVTFRASLLSYLKFIAAKYGLDIPETIIQNYFLSLVQQLNEKFGKVVILVDEYDKPLVDTLQDSVRFEENRVVLNDLYSSFKSLDSQIRFVFLTGVSRFAKVGIFSGLNNLQDLTLDAQFNEIAGFTQEELESHFADRIETLKTMFPVSSNELLAGIKEWYNGYSWDGKTKLYNPFSILNLFQQKQFLNYWFSTGTPSFLMKAIIQQEQVPSNIENLVMTDLIGGSTINERLAVAPVLFQTGYLTIKKITHQRFQPFYHLGLPNNEVKMSFYTHLLSAFLKQDIYAIQPGATSLRDSLEAEDIEQFINLLTSYLAAIPARLHIPKEAFYHAIFFMVLRLLGVEMLLERETDKGRIDGVIELTDKIYIIEIKFATNKRIKNVQTLVRQALKQIKDRKYYEPYLDSGKKIILLGIGILDKQIKARMELLENKK